MECAIYDIPCHLTGFIQYLKDLFISLYDAILQGVVVLLDLIPVPSFLQSVSFTFPPSVSYFLDIFMLQEGLLIMVGAYIARFIIRRLPFIG